MLINGKKNKISQEDLIITGKKMDISLPRIKAIISEVKDTVINWPKFAESVGIRKESYEKIQSIISDTFKEL